MPFPEELDELPEEEWDLLDEPLEPDLPEDELDPELLELAALHVMSNENRTMTKSRLYLRFIVES